MQDMKGRRVGEEEEEEEEEKNRGKVFPCMMTDGLYLDDATQRGGGPGGGCQEKAKRGGKYFCFDNFLQSRGEKKPDRPNCCKIFLHQHGRL